MKTLFLLVFAIITIAACDSRGADSPSKRTAGNCLMATVVSTRNTDCGYAMLSFAEDSAAIHAVTAQKDIVYIARYLPDSLNVEGKKLCVTVAKLQPEEEFPCKAIGPAFPHIKVVSAKERQ